MTEGKGMQINVGTPDRIIRLILGIALLLWAWLGSLSTLWFWVALVVGLVLVVTAVLRFCPAYAVLGASTCPRK